MEFILFHFFSIVAFTNSQVFFSSDVSVLPVGMFVFLLSVWFSVVFIEFPIFCLVFSVLALIFFHEFHCFWFMRNTTHFFRFEKLQFSFLPVVVGHRICLCFNLTAIFRIFSQTLKLAIHLKLEYTMCILCMHVVDHVCTMANIN